MPMTPSELLARAQALGLDHSATIAARRGEPAPDPMFATHRKRANKARAVDCLIGLQTEVADLANLEAYLAELEEERAEAAAAAERERLDPLTQLDAPLEPTDPTDAVFLMRCGGLPFGTEFRRADGKRYQYRAPRPAAGLLRRDDPAEVACLPREDADALGLSGVSTGAMFDDLLGMIEPWHARRYPDPNARDYYPAMDWAVSIAKSNDPQMMEVIGRWGRFVRKVPGREALYDAIRKQLATHGRLDLIEDEHAQIMASSSGNGPTHTHDTPVSTSSSSTMATREWAQRGSR